MECSRSHIYVAIAFCTIFFVYEMLQHVETRKMLNFSVFNSGSKSNSLFLHDANENDVNNVIKVLERMKKIASDRNDILDIDSSIAFLKSELVQTDETPDDGTNDYFVTNKLWDTKHPQWKEHFYPDANYSGEVCSEVYVRPGDKSPWPYFKLKDSCTKDSPKTISYLVTIVLNFQSYSKAQFNDITRLVTNIQRLYPRIVTYMALPDALTFHNTTDKVSVFNVSRSDKPGEVWNRLIQNVTTKYVFIGRDIVDFEKDSNLERLVREIHPLNLNMIGSAVKTYSNGHWSYGCYQMAHKNYTLVYKHGYKHSAHDCLYCDSIQGPVLAKTNFLKVNPMDPKLPESILFHDYFFALFKKNQLVGVCPDSMFNVRDEATQSLSKNQWLPLVIKRSLNKLTDPGGKSFVYSCSESSVPGKKQGGLAIAPCMLQKLADHIKFVMRTCRENNIFCELNAGTTLGAVKFNGVSPWERDADIFFLSSNFSAVEKLETLFRKAGYSLKIHIKPGQEGAHNGAFHSGGSGWKLEFWSKPWMHSAQLKSQGRKPTTVMFNGEWVEVPTNVGQEIRDRYGPEVYKHVEHSMVLKKEHFSGKTGYTWAGHFTKCPKPGSNNCLDQLPPDGNLQFNSDPVP